MAAKPREQVNQVHFRELNTSRIIKFHSKLIKSNSTEFKAHFRKTNASSIRDQNEQYYSH